ncbi:hypothetical protein AWB67_05554 [Caballeronia terrestris]|uniref:Uncharacterized protein n=2 Tax=Caballeronia terrestris TaxID=1226301 RepID=A0A158KFV4_9BURK|nr:hypothetical protein AWB67_05554 [Caballeronia terrestris]
MSVDTSHMNIVEKGAATADSDTVTVLAISHQLEDDHH